MRFDSARRQFEVAVRDLVDDDRYHRVGFERSETWRRFGLGNEIHQELLSARERDFPAYRREVHLSARFPVDDWTAIVTGRLDGCLERRPGEWLIEEVKSLCFEEDPRRFLAAAVFERYRRQLALYCLLWTHLGQGRADGRLVFVDVATRREQSVSIAFDLDETNRDLQKRLHRRLAEHRALEADRIRKAEIAADLPFPYPSPREVQEPLIEAIAEALRTGGHLIAEAPTGSGKTAAALHPAIRYGLTEGKQVVFLTAKTLQQDMAVATTEAINRGGFRSLRLRAKEKMCANDRVICHEDFCPYARGYPEKMGKNGLIADLLGHHRHLAPEIVYEASRREEVCPFEVQLELAQRVDVLIGDYNYVFEPSVALRHLREDGLGDAILLVDEAHNLPDRVRQIYSPQILEMDLAAVENRLALTAGELFEDLRDAIGVWRRILTQCAEETLPEGEAIAEADLPRKEILTARALWEPRLLRYLDWKRETRFQEEDDPILGLHFQLMRFVAVLLDARSDFAQIIERRRDGLRVAVVCLDPARILAPVVNGASSTILLSATLTPVESVRRLTGLDPDRTVSVSLPPPFPPENRRILILPQVRTNYAARERHYGRIAALLAELADAHAGNDLALFPSYRFLREVASRLPATTSRVFSQREDASDFERTEILRMLENPPAEGVLLLAVSGGMYAEGVDYPGERLSGVFIVSPALPQVSFERELLRRYFDDQDESGFEYAYLLPGMTRVIQAAGRLIRGESDRGVIALLCHRFLEEPYSRFLPRDWYARDPRELISTRPGTAVRQFFEGSAEGGS
jgi:DNA excision repair protein ERCC-2